MADSETSLPAQNETRTTLGRGGGDDHMSHEILFTERETAYGFFVVPVVYCAEGIVE